MFFDHRAEYSSEWAAITSIASKFGMAPETLRAWVRRVQVDEGQRAGLTTDERQKMRDLEREVRELRRANEMADSTGERTGSCEMSESRSREDASIFFATELDGRPKR
jgi:transposase-like protein